MQNYFTSGVTSTASSERMFTNDTRQLGLDWHDHFLGEGISERFFRIDGPEFVVRTSMWLAKIGDMPITKKEARQRFRLPESNPGSHAHVFEFEIPPDFTGLQYPVVLLASKEVKTLVWQAKIQDQLVPLVRFVKTFTLQ